MRTKAQIVQDLLEAKHINVEEAMVLIQEVTKEVQYIPYQPEPLQWIRPTWEWKPQYAPVYGIGGTLSNEIPCINATYNYGQNGGTIKMSIAK